MLNFIKGSFLGLLWRLTDRLRFPQLFALVAALFVLDLLIPDLLPFVDEILLGLVTLLLGNWTRKKRIEKPDAPGAQAEGDTVIDIKSE